MTQEQNTETVALSMENVKELFQEMFKGQEQALFKIPSSCINTLKQRLDKLTLQVIDDNSKLKKICKEADDLKLSLDASLNIYEDKLNKLEKDIDLKKRKIEQTWKEYGMTATNFMRN